MVPNFRSIPRSPFALLCALVLSHGLLGVSAPARASLVQDIYECTDATGAVCTMLVGTIEFPAASGNDPTGIVLTYYSFDQTDIQSVEWDISNVDWLLTTFEMVLNDNPGCVAGAGPCSVSITSFEVMATPGLSFSGYRADNCPAVGVCTMISAPGGDRFVPTAEVPAPDTALLVLPLAGMVLLRGRRQRDVAMTR